MYIGMQNRGLASALALLLTLFYGGTALAELYDDFDDADLIDSALWQQPINFSNFVENGKLRVEQRQRGANAGNDIRFLNPIPINTIESKINVLEATANNALARSRIAGFFCDTDNQANGNTGEVLAEIGIGRNDNDRVVVISLFLCTAANCATGTALLDTTQQFSSFPTPAFNTEHTVAVGFNDSTDTFSFTYDGMTRTFGPGQIPQLAGCGPSHTEFKAIGSRVSNIGNPQAEGRIVATIDDVRTNNTLYDNFSQPFLSDDKWGERDLERAALVVTRANNNAASLRQRRAETNDRSFNMNFVNPTAINSIRADVRVENTQITDPVPDANSGGVQARILGYFYNDGSSTGANDQTGDVFFRIALLRSLGNNPQRSIFCLIERVDDPDFNESTTIVQQSFGTWTENQTYSLAIGFDPASKTFTCAVDNQIETYTLQPTDPQPQAGAQIGAGAFKALGLRVSGVAGSGEVGNIAATFDNVEINFLDTNRLLSDDFDQ